MSRYDKNTYRKKKYSEKKKEKKSIFERQKDNKDHIVF